MALLLSPVLPRETGGFDGESEEELCSKEHSTDEVVLCLVRLVINKHLLLSDIIAVRGPRRIQ
jgi:hypothetical protein